LRSTALVAHAGGHPHALGRRAHAAAPGLHVRVALRLRFAPSADSRRRLGGDFSVVPTSSRAVVVSPSESSGTVVTHPTKAPSPRHAETFARRAADVDAAPVPRGRRGRVRPAGVPRHAERPRRRARRRRPRGAARPSHRGRARGRHGPRAGARGARGHVRAALPRGSDARPAYSRGLSAGPSRSTDRPGSRGRARRGTSSAAQMAPSVLVEFKPTWGRVFGDYLEEFTHWTCVSIERV